MAVYFIRQDVSGPVKIGVANDVVKRLRQLQTNQPVALYILRVVEGERAAEAALHERFRDLRLSGEWFTYRPEMIEADLGFADLPKPAIKRNFGRNYFPENAWGRERCLHHEILITIGGADTLARRMRLPPWEVVPHGINPRYFSATVLLLIEAGRHDITLDTLFDAQAATQTESAKAAEHNARIQAEQLNAFHDRRLGDWIEKHGRAAAWWPLPEEPPALADDAEAAA